MPVSMNSIIRGGIVNRKRIGGRIAGADIPGHFDATRPPNIEVCHGGIGYAVGVFGYQLEGIWHIIVCSKAAHCHHNLIARDRTCTMQGRAFDKILIGIGIGIGIFHSQLSMGPTLVGHGCQFHLRLSKNGYVRLLPIAQASMLRHCLQAKGIWAVFGCRFSRERNGNRSGIYHGVHG